ncbi:cupin domain-containing protein [Nostocoides sp. F2B08]|uniref:cupin domain-containing protein n=1 Tax=Nostocoides sp. F2B08 TaxID=2653936 RepID=UPI0012638856|nr:cupin domain-containing protein [Tetrasphaera sp. F2B08]KAB7743478.1 cupin domain-containing protein [Tetrasphaera sp. F2B08]
MAHIIRAGAGEVLGPPTGCQDRFVVDSRETDGRLALVEHILAPHSIAAPMHRHSREDEMSVILEGRVWFVAAGEEHVAEVGDVVVKPRGEWHTFWNAADSPARLMELIHPGGLEHGFRTMDTSEDDDVLAQVAIDYGCDLDLDATGPIMERYGLVFA